MWGGDRIAFVEAVLNSIQEGILKIVRKILPISLNRGVMRKLST